MTSSVTETKNLKQKCNKSRIHLLSKGDREWPLSVLTKNVGIDTDKKKYLFIKMSLPSQQKERERQLLKKNGNMNSTRVKERTSHTQGLLSGPFLCLHFYKQFPNKTVF